MKAFISLFVLGLLVSAGARADIIITLDNPNQTGNPGDTLSFSGTIANTDPNSDDPAIYLNSDSPDFVGPADATFEDDFLTNVPTSLAPGATSGDIDLFDIVLANPETDSFALYSGSTYTLLGGADGGADTAQDVLATANFSVDVEPPASSTPEPATFVLLGAGLALLALWGHPRVVRVRDSR